MLDITPSDDIHSKTINTVADANNLIRAYYKARVNSAWKESVQRYGIHLLENTYKLQSELLDGSYKQMPFYEFDINERGKQRHIKSNNIRDRVVQRSLCDNVLNSLYKYCIYDNGASIVGRGIDFARRRLKTHLRKYIKKYGTNGYMLKIDFKKFFDNIPHKDLIVKLREKEVDESIIKLIETLLAAFKDDTLGYSKSVGIGSQLSQFAGIFYPNNIDTYCKYVKQCKYYGRYMDDIYIIHPSKEYLKELLKEISSIATQNKLFIHRDKTQIIKLSHGFTFLQIKYIITKTCKIITILSKKSTSRERRRLKRLFKLFNNGVNIAIDNAYKSWKGNAQKYHAYRRIKNLDKLFIKLETEVKQ